jgi:2-methylcitrate dehydratase
MRGHLPSHQVAAILDATREAVRLDAMPVQAFMALFTL